MTAFAIVGNHDELGSWFIGAVVILFCLTVAARGLMGRPSITTEDEPIQVPTESPADTEWRRRLTRWTAEQDAS